MATLIESTVLDLNTYTYVHICTCSLYRKQMYLRSRLYIECITNPNRFKFISLVFSSFVAVFLPFAVQCGFNKYTMNYTYYI